MDKKRRKAVCSSLTVTCWCIKESQLCCTTCDKILTKDVSTSQFDMITTNPK